MEEDLREASCIGDVNKVVQLLEKGVDINSQNKVNGWTALHWASKRGHAFIVSTLLKQGANANIKSSKGQTPRHVAIDSHVLSLLPPSSSEELDVASESPLPFLPNYLAHPEFFYATRQRGKDLEEVPRSPCYESTTNKPSIEDHSRIVKVRRFHPLINSDFIEIEIIGEKGDEIYATLLHKICCELNVSRDAVAKLRKLPNTLVRNDDDVLRLKPMQELEVVLK